MSKLPINIKRLKQQANKLKKDLGLPHSEALKRVAQEHRFGNWKAVVDADRKSKTLETPTPPISIKFIENEDITLNEDDEDTLSQERVNDLDDETKLKVTRNKKELTKLAIEFSIFEPTITGLKKSILDATQPIRTHFELTNFHKYQDQLQGAAEHKVIKNTYFLTSTKKIGSKVSLYRPKTKKGDPRMWFSSLGTFACAGDQVAIVILDNCSYLINLSKTDIHQALDLSDNPLKSFIHQYTKLNNSIADDLLEKLRTLAKSPIKATHIGDTAVGMSIENALGIAANSSKLPDYKGIELKSGRGLKNRSTLFAQVADWSLSPCKRSADILDKYGYAREDDFKLYCTLSTRKPNSQGLCFRYNQENDELQEWYIKDKKSEHVATWTGALLRARLKEKHTETFWIEAKSEMIAGEEFFHLKSVTHTKAPLLSQLMPLIESGIITMDHLIKRKGGTNRVSEKGPLFKMDQRDFNLLFPEPIKYKLV